MEKTLKELVRSGRVTLEADDFCLTLDTTNFSSAYACLLDIKEAPKNTFLFLEIWIGQNMVAGSVWNNNQLKYILEDLIQILGLIVDVEKKTILYR